MTGKLGLFITAHLGVSHPVPSSLSAPLSREYLMFKKKAIAEKPLVRKIRLIFPFSTISLIYTVRGNSCKGSGADQ